MSEIGVRHEEGDRYRIEVRGHTMWVDQPKQDGGDDSAPTPTELFVAGLGSCVAFFGGRYLERHHLSTNGFGVDCSFDYAEDRPARVAAITISVVLPETFPAERREAFLAVVEHCTVHNSMTTTPEIAIALRDRSRAA
jgi:uncharacterized OsmC-like protein